MVAAAIAIAALPARADEPIVDFDRDIQPILARCVQCHGPGTHEAGLRLDLLEGAAATLESGNRALVPGDANQSVMLARVSAEDPAERMPPMGEPLTATQIATLRRWIAAGAVWPAHWAYRPLVPPPVPAVPGEYAVWPRTPIDHFILEKLFERGLTPSPEADKRTLLRRVSFDLVGLPPTPEELAAFLADDTAKAYDRVVERLLSSPHYGERWARHWMDVVHFAETHGNDQDRPRPNAWPYRDWLIRSFNADKPYARFVAEQVAGDALFPSDPEAIVATGFLATGPWDESSLRDINENGIDREIARYLDRDDIVTTVMSTFASSTVHCARCHDHKFDPIVQREYYALQAVFAATDKSDRAYDADPAVAQKRRELNERLAALPALRDAADPSLLDAALQAEVAAWEQSLGDASLIWSTVDPVEFRSAEGATLTKLPDLSILSGGERPEKETYTIKFHTALSGITGLRVELLTDESLPHGGPGRQDNGNLHLNELTVRVAPVGDASQARPLRLANPRSDFDQDGWTVAMALDGNPATAWGIYPQVGQPHSAAFEIVDYPALAGEAEISVRLEQTHGGGHTIGRLRLAVANAPLPLPLEPDVLPADIAEALRLPAEARSDAHRATLAAHIVRQRLERELSSLPPQQLVYCGSNRFAADGSFRPSAVPRTVYVLDRGNIATPREEATPGALSCLPDLAAGFELADAGDEGARRAALARWLTDERNVLAWRSIVNRVWHYHFGRGLCDTPNDFGRMGAAPSHRELLDWLACEFRAGGGSLKDLHRLMVTSAAYRQASAHRDDYAALDGDNRLLWRMNRARLDAESIRDAVLVVSGKLDPTMGGPSVKQFIQSPGIHVTPVVDYLNFEADDPANFRRSVYRFIFRTLPDPFMDSLDCADSSQLTPARNTSVTALQALSMLNNKFIVRQSEHLAERVRSECGDLAGQIARLYRLALLREPTPEESAAFLEYAGRHGLANACRVLLNSNEFMFVN